jgi:hypothetical protein
MQDEGSPLANLRRLFQGVLKLPKGNEGLFDYLFCIAVGGAYPRGVEPNWGALIADSGSGKSLVTLMLNGLAEYIYEGDDVTDRALVSCKPDEATGKAPSMLERLNGKTYLVDDFSVIASARDDEAARIASQFRTVYKGRYSKDSGMGDGRRQAVGRFNILMAAVQEMDDWILKHGQLGQRFIIYRMHIPRPVRDAYSDHVIRMQPTEHIWKAQLEAALADQLLPIIRALPKDPEKITPPLPDKYRHAMIRLTGTVVDLRTFPKGLTQSTGKISYPLLQRAAQEVATRLPRQFIVLGWTRARVDAREAWNDSDLRFIKRIAWDTIPYLGQCLVRILHDKPEGLTLLEMKDRLYLPLSAITSIAYCWGSIGIMQRPSAGGKWAFEETFRHRINEVWESEREWWPHFPSHKKGK